MKSFNLALETKLVWTWAHKETSIWAMIWKGKHVYNISWEYLPKALLFLTSSQLGIRSNVIWSLFMQTMFGKLGMVPQLCSRKIHGTNSHPLILAWLPNHFVFQITYFQHLKSIDFGARNSMVI